MLIPICQVSAGISSGGDAVVAESLVSFRIRVTYQQFVDASAQEQLEIVSELLRKANAEYKAAETIEEMYDLRSNMDMIDLFIRSGKRSFLTQQKDYNILYSKIIRTIREYEGGTTVYDETGGYSDSGQELD
jgi:hypothetical protein